MIVAICARESTEQNGVANQEKSVARQFELDMRLPYLSGQEVIVELRDRRYALKVLAISAYRTHVPGDVPFLAKPFGRDDLLRAVRETLKGKPDAE
jgi:FixJ family two-component response regulator